MSQEEKKCPYCSQTFLRSEHLSRHVRKHTGEKPFGCDVCGKIYARHDTLLRHKRSHRASASPSNALPASVVRNGSNEASFGSDLHGASRPQRYSLSPLSNSSISADRNMRVDNMVSEQIVDGPSVYNNNVNKDKDVPVQQSTQAWIEGSLARSLHHIPDLGDSSGSREALTRPRAGDFVSNVDYASNDLDMWTFNDETSWTVWSVGSEFNLEAMNASIAETLQPPLVPIQAVYTMPMSTVDINSSLMRQITAPDNMLDRVEKAWCSYNDPDVTVNPLPGTVTPLVEHESGERHDIDETYRYNLSSRLQPRPYDSSLPSTEFLNLSVRLYFARFHPIFPIVHAPTFRPSMTKSLLLLSICSIGSLFTASSSAMAQGAKIFETLNKCIINSWDRYLARSSTEALSMIQASLLGQTFAILSGVPARLNLAQAYHGTIVAWARQGKMFQEQSADPPVMATGVDAADLDTAWKAWAQQQQRIRLVLGIQVHDAELAVMFHHEPLLRHEKESVRACSSEQLFNATTAVKWQVLAQKNQRPGQGSDSVNGTPSQLGHSLSGLDKYARLDGIAASICDSRQQGLLDKEKEFTFVKALMQWQHDAKALWKHQSPDPLCLVILWHSTFISLFSDSQRMESAIGKDGVAGASQSQGYVVEWASSTAAWRCHLHASFLQRQVESIQFGHEPATHVPRCLFQAAYVRYLYGKHAAPGSPLKNQAFPEIKQIGTALPQELLQRTMNAFETNVPADLSSLYALKDLLERVGRWGLGKKYASILGLLIESDDSRPNNI